MQTPTPDTADWTPLVAFDFDGTLTVRDSFTDFLRWRAGARGYVASLTLLAPNMAAYLLHQDRGRIKAAAIRRFLRGVPRDVLIADGRGYADAMAPRLFRPDAMEVWNDWGARGARRVIVTASPALLVQPFAERLGADSLLGTELLFDDRDRVAGAAMGPNNRGAEKVRRLREAYGPDVRLTAAYGDSSGDHDMLEIADIKGYCVFKGRP